MRLPSPSRLLSAVTLTLYIEKAFPFTTQNLRNPQMALEVKPQKKGYLSIISKIPTNRQKKKKKRKKNIGHSKFMYTYTLRKELSVELGRGWVRGKERGERFGQLVKPCIFTIQGSYRGCQDGRPGSDRVRGRKESRGCMFTSSWGLERCGVG